MMMVVMEEKLFQLLNSCTIAILQMKHAQSTEPEVMTMVLNAPTSLCAEIATLVIHALYLTLTLSTTLMNSDQSQESKL